MGERNDLIRELTEIDQDRHGAKNTHLLSWLGKGYFHCQHGSEEWCQGDYLDSARAYIERLEAVAKDALTTIASLSEALAEAEKKGAEDWQPIETAPKGRKILAGYFNRLGNWRTVTARYYVANTLPADDDSEEYFAPEGWYECSETNEHILQLEYPPTHWRPLPAPPRDLSQGGQHG